MPEAIEMVNQLPPPNGNITLLYTACGWEWRQWRQKRRPISTVTLAEEVAKRILDDCRKFLDSEKWYEDFDVRYQRLYLLYGPSGCGKNSFINALAGEIGFSICTLDLSERGLTEDRLIHLVNGAPKQSIIVFEGIDAAFGPRENSHQAEAASVGLNRVTFNGFMICLDHMVSTEARIVFMTMSSLERLDPQLSGRLQVKQFIGYCSQYQLEEMFKRFYGNGENETAGTETHRDFSEKVLQIDKAVTPAQIMHYFMANNFLGPDGIVENIPKIWESS